MSAVPDLEQIWPAIQDVHVLQTDNVCTLFCRGLIDEGAIDCFGQRTHRLKIHNVKWTIPRIATSRSALQFIGFNLETIEEIWAYINHPMSATPMVTIPTKVSEFWNRVQVWLDNRTRAIMVTAAADDTSSKELLDRLGLHNAAQIQHYQLNSPPIFGGSQTFSLVQVVESDVLAWAKRGISRKWNVIETLEYAIFRGGDKIDEEGWANVVKEFTTNPIDSEMAFVFDPTFLLQAKEVKLKESSKEIS